MVLYISTFLNKNWKQATRYTWFVLTVSLLIYLIISITLQDTEPGGKKLGGKVSDTISKGSKVQFPRYLYGTICFSRYGRMFGGGGVTPLPRMKRWATTPPT